MSDINSLEGRLNSAIARIEKATSEGGDNSDLEAENAKLRTDFDKLKEQRHADMEHLAKMMAKIRPFLEKKNA